MALLSKAQPIASDAVQSELSMFQYLKWFVVLMFVPQILTHLLLGTVLQIPITPLEQARFDMLLIYNLLIGLLSLPIILHVKKLAPRYFAMEQLSTRQVINIFFIGCIISLSFTLIYEIFHIEQSDFLAELNDSLKNIVLGFVTICILGPIVEEVLYRGLLFAGLQKAKVNSFLILCITALVFTAIHVQYSVAELSFVFVYGFFLGYVRLKTNNLLLCIALHMFNNFYNFVLLTSN